MPEIIGIDHIYIAVSDLVLAEAFYDRATFDALYDADNLASLTRRYDPDHRFTSLYDKVVRRR